MATTGAQRIVTLDIVRGLAVMGILAMNIVAFAMPPQAYINPLAYAPSALDTAIYIFNFIFIDGKMRGLFSFLFGASMLLVIQLARSQGESAARVTFSRQLWLLVFGMLHYYLIWYGDILIGYALIGMVAWHFRDHSPEKLVGWGVALVLLQLFVMGSFALLAHQLGGPVATGTATAEQAELWRQLTTDIAVPSPESLRETMALYLGPWSGIVERQTGDKLLMPFVFTLVFGWETLAYMLFGMAALKTGLLTGAWEAARYRKLAILGLAITVPAYVVLALLLWNDGFSVTSLYSWAMAATVPFRPIMVAAYAALIVLLTRNGGWLVDRIAAAGRAAFTNYLGTSIVMTGLFYGWGVGLFGSLGRAELWLVVIAMWVVMLAWSKPWLDRFRYGPFEWLWRSLARMKPQPMRKISAAR